MTLFNLRHVSDETMSFNLNELLQLKQTWEKHMLFSFILLD